MPKQNLLQSSNKVIKKTETFIIIMKEIIAFGDGCFLETFFFNLRSLRTFKLELVFQELHQDFYIAILYLFLIKSNN